MNDIGSDKGFFRCGVSSWFAGVRGVYSWEGYGAQKWSWGTRGYPEATGKLCPQGPARPLLRARI